MNRGKILIDYYSIMKDLVRNFWVVVLSLVIGVMGIYIAEYSIYKPEYTSTATAVVNVKGSTVNSSATYNVSSDMAQVFS